MRDVRFVCCLALLAGVIVFGADRAGAQVSNAARQACAPDAVRLCSDYIPDVPKVTACMKSKIAELSPDCRTVMNGGEPGGKAATGSHRRYRHCGKYSRHSG
jgi:hypothetical protein